MKLKKNEPIILLTNDDGVEAEGLKMITKALCGLGTIVVFAPDSPQSGMSSSITTMKPVRYRLLNEEENLQVYSCSGTPVDCVKLAMNEVLPVKPDLLVSGINHGENQGVSVHYSGTMGAAFEGCLFDIPSIGVSLCDYPPVFEFSESCRLSRILAEYVLKHGLPHGTYLNLNVPNIPAVKGIAVGRQSDGKWVREYIRHEEDGDISFWLTGEYKLFEPIYPDNDFTLLENGYASLVPCKIDVTDYAFMEELKKEFSTHAQDIIFPKGTKFTQNFTYS